AVLDKCLHIVTHGIAPILVVSHAEQQAIGSEQIQVVVLMNVEVGTIVHGVAVLFEPNNDRSVPVDKRLTRRRVKWIRIEDIPGSASRAATRSANTDGGWNGYGQMMSFGN